MSRLLIGLMLLVVPAVAVAQDSGEAAPPAKADAPTADYRTYTAKDFGFSVSLPASGTITDPASKDWSEEKQVAFVWEGTLDEAKGTYAEPIALIQGRVDTFGATIDAEAFKTFCDELLGNWQGDEKKYEVITENDTLDVDGAKWNLIQIEDSSDSGGVKVYYSVFSTYKDDSIYTLSMYYMKPIDDEIQGYGAPVLSGFKVTKVAAPGA